jgi:ankyrin repeat protein
VAEAVTLFNSARDNGYTVLMIAAAAGKAGVVKMLLAAGADPYKVSWEGETAISIAHSYGFFEIVRMLSSTARFCGRFLLPCVCSCLFYLVTLSVAQTI